MADNTTNYGFNLPQVDGSEDQWGDLLNQNWSDLDVLLLARDQNISALEERTLAAGDGLDGGGDLSTDITITMGTPGTLDGGTPNNVTEGSHTHAIASTADRTDSSTTTLLQAAGMNDHRTSGDHDARYAQLEEPNDFSDMPSVQGDPVVESGSNSDGEWTRWADGTQLCSNYFPGSGSIDTWNYPVSFLTYVTRLSGACMEINETFVRVPHFQDRTTSSVRVANVFYSKSSSNVGFSSTPYSVSATGRWK